jgi:hypothetical protein
MAVAASAIERFPGGRVFWAVWVSTEEAMGRLPMVLLTPVVAALAGTALAVSQPSSSVVHSSQGLIVAAPSFWNVLWLALAGSAGGVIVVGGLLFWGMWLYIRAWLPLWDRFRGWEPRLEPFPDQEAARLLLLCRMTPPVQISTLGHMECAVKRPDGSIDLIPDLSIVPSEVPLGDNEAETVPGAMALLGRATPGPYEVRWYGTNRKRYEIARKKFLIPAVPEDSKKCADKRDGNQP